ncbi:TPA: hypothetical protein R4A47_004320 [Salmonella enterica subsp. enterica serovar Schwarzengrund]|nr:hypothetical protein [Salmonella enterica subsp. enterica serovar Schwarzengrund]EHI1961793.1 hypothetical protein [Salmonella enterica]EBS6537802.1 hypothetical protein [Salmonella enterica subsp. enterica serovar Schwarzengrund]EBS6569941.1 hypothetical protein [Salmonella enterica subsp. enterica serovar Schwarzengrund]EBY5954577.1 hypothetical protein [Salmonella enterica subsp. enterica serovar Schwarzengrund]
MIITINDNEYNKLYEAGNLDREAIIDTIVKAGGTDKVRVSVCYNGQNPLDITINEEEKETLDTLSFLKGIFEDINNVILEHTPSDTICMALMKWGYDMSVLDDFGIPHIANFGKEALLEVIKNGLDMSQFTRSDHFDLSNDNHLFSRFINTNEKLEVFLQNGLLTSDTIKDYEYYEHLKLYNRKDLELSDKGFELLFKCYDSILIESRMLTFRCLYTGETRINPALFELTNNVKYLDNLFKRYIEVSPDKIEAVNFIKDLFQKSESHDLNSGNYPNTVTTIEDIEIQNVFKQSQPKPSTRRRM